MYRRESGIRMNESTKKQKEYIAIDIFRFVCALMVISLHIRPFTDFSFELGFWMEEIISRIAVPFFFVTSGFFLAAKIQDRNRVKCYFMKVLRLYLVYTILYFPQIVYSFRKVGEGPVDFIRTFLHDFLLSGPYTHLWYFRALLVVVFLIYILKNRTSLSDRKLLLGAFVLYVIGCAGCTYRNFVIQNNILGMIILGYEKIFVTTRNGLFFGFFYSFLGYYAWNFKSKISEKYFGIFAVFSLILLHAEAYILRFALHIEEGFDMLYTLPLVVYFLFRLLCSIRVSVYYAQIGRYLRKLSTLMFGLHLFVKFYLHWILLHIVKSSLKSLPYYLVMTAATIGVSCFIIWMENRKGFEFLKLLS